MGWPFQGESETKQKINRLYLDTVQARASPVSSKAPLVSIFFWCCFSVACRGHSDLSQHVTHSRNGGWAISEWQQQDICKLLESNFMPSNGPGTNGSKSNPNNSTLLETFKLWDFFYFFLSMHIHDYVMSSAQSGHYFFSQMPNDCQNECVFTVSSACI